MSAASAGTLIAAATQSRSGALLAREGETTEGDFNPVLAPGAPTSPERAALVDSFLKRSEGLQDQFEPRTHKSDWTMPYRPFHPKSSQRLPLVMYLHGSGGLGDDNLKQLSLGNRFGTRVWLLPENQRRFPCYVVAPQTDRGWIQYDLSREPATVLPGFGNGDRLALEIVDKLCHEFAIDKQRLYIAGNSMGGAGVWNMLAHRPNLFAAAVISCAGESSDDGTGSPGTPSWTFHGTADKVVPVSSARDRIAARRRVGGHPIYTEYVGASHNGTTALAFTEPELPNWVFSQRRA